MAPFGGTNDWKGKPDNIWQEGYDRLGTYDQLAIQEIANEKFGGDIIKAMQFRFKDNVQLALLGHLPKDWQIFSDKERQDMAALQAELGSDPDFIASLEDLFTGINDIDETTELRPIKKNSRPKNS